MVAQIRRCAPQSKRSSFPVAPSPKKPTHFSPAPILYAPFPAQSQYLMQAIPTLTTRTLLIAAGVVGGSLLLRGMFSTPKIPRLTQPPPQLPFDDLLKLYCREFNESGIMQKIIPKKYETRDQLERITSNLFYTHGDGNLDSLTKALSEPIWDLLERGGKRWRPVLCMLVAEVFGCRRDYVYDIAALCEIVHNGTLIVDDIEDQSKVRRNKECVHLIYGVDISINAGNFMYFAPLLYLMRSGKYTREQQLRMGTIFMEEMTSLHVGQGWDILWHNTEKLGGKFPTESDYLQMTAHKTGVLARLSTRLVCVALNIPYEQEVVLARLAEAMGVAFQIKDDLLNLEGEEYIKTKGFSGEDIHEGKMSLMVLYTLNNSDKAERLLQILKSKTEDQKLIDQAITILRESGSFQYAKQTMNRLIDQAWNEANNRLPESQHKKYLKDLAYFNINRSI